MARLVPLDLQVSGQTEDQQERKKRLVPVEEQQAPTRRLVPLEGQDDDRAQQELRVGRFRSGLNTALGTFSGEFVEKLPKSVALLGAIGGSIAFEAVDDPRGLAVAAAQGQVGGGGVGGMVQGIISKAIKESSFDVESSPVYQFGEKVGRAVDEIFPQNPEYQDRFLTKLLAGGGQLGATYLTGLATGGAGSIVQASLSQSAGEFAAAKASGATDEEAFQSYLLNLPIGATEAIPVGRALRRFDNVTGGGFKKVLASGVAGTLEEAAQEAVQTSLSNVVVKNVYDETRKILDGVGESALLGGILGGTVNGLGVGLRLQGQKARNLQEAAGVREAYEEVRNFITATSPKGPISEAALRDPKTYEAARIATDVILNSTLPPGDDLKQQLRDSVEAFGFEDLVRKIDSQEAMFSDLESVQGEPTGEQGESGLTVTRMARSTSGGGSFPPPPDIGWTRKQLPPSSPENVTPEDTDLDIGEWEALGTVKKKILGWLDPRLKLPKGIKGLLNKSEGSVGKEIVEVHQVTRRVVNSIRRQHLGAKNDIGTRRFYASEDSQKIGPEVWMAIDAVLRGNAIRPGDPIIDASRTLTGVELPSVHNLPINPNQPQDAQTYAGPMVVPEDVVDNDLWREIMDMRSHVDRLSRTGLHEGLFEGPLEVRINQNLGTYLHRSYKKHDVPDWAQNVPPELVTKAYSYIEDSYQRAGVPLNSIQINNLVNHILKGPDSELQILSGGKIGQVDTGPLRKRDETIAPEIRALMGEYSNPLANYVKTVGHLANIVHNGVFLKDTAQRYKGILFYEDPLNAPPAFQEQIAAEGNASMGALAGLYTHPDIAEAFSKVFTQKDLSDTLTWLVRLNSAAKYSKTLLNNITHARNIYGGAMFSLANGHWPRAEYFKKGFAAAKSVATGKTPLELEEKMRRLAELGIDVEGARSGEIREIINLSELGSTDWVAANFNHILAKPGSLYSKLSLSVDAIADLYKAEDVGIRTMMYESELARYKDAYDGTDKSTEEIETEVADIIRRTYQNYDEVPYRVRLLNRFPFLGTFVSFQSEVIRTTFGIAGQARAEMRSDNPKIQAIGRQRLFGLLATSSGRFVAHAAAAMLLGIGGREDDDIKRFVAPWDKEGSLVYLNNSGTTRSFINPSYYDPWALLTDPINALVSGEPEHSAFDKYVEAWKTFLEPFFGEEIMGKKILEVQANKKRTGGSVYNQADSFAEKARDVAFYMWDGLEPGVVNNIDKTVRAVSGLPSDSGQKLDPTTEILANVFGIRPTSVDIPRSLRFRGIEFSRTSSEAKRIYNTELRNPLSTSTERFSALNRANVAYKEAFDKVVQDAEAAYRLGVSWTEVETQLKNANISKERIAQIRNRRFVPFELEVP